MKPRSVFGIMAAIFGALTAVATVAGFFGDIWWGFDFVANYRWQLMWIALGASVVYALTETGIITAVFVAAVLVNAWTIAPAWLGSQPVATGEDGVRIVHIDLSGAIDEVPSIVPWLLAQDADLLLLAGLSPAEAALLPLDDSPYEQIWAPDVGTGVAIFGLDHWAVDTTVTESGERVHLVTVPSGAGVMNVVTSWGGMGTSQPAHDVLADRFRVISKVVSDASDPVAVVGNLGATKWSDVSRDLLARSPLRDGTEGAGYLSTSPVSGLPIFGRWIGIPIDVFYLGPELTPLDLIVGPDIDAEHLPITIVVGPTQ